jgi:hypothetical protein
MNPHYKESKRLAGFYFSGKPFTQALILSEDKPEMAIYINAG